MRRKSIQLIISILFLIELITPIYAGEGSTYEFSWLDPDKEIYVLQNRKFRKDNNFHINLGGAYTIGQPFVDSYGAQARIGYFVHEEYGFEAIYTKSFGKENSTFKSVQNPGGSGSTPFRRVTQNYMGIMGIWAPFYGKINTFNKILYVDWMIEAGYGKLQETNNREEFENAFDPKDITETHDAIIWGTGLKFYITKMWHIRFDVTGLHYQAQKALVTATASDKQWYDHYDLDLSFGINF